MGRINSTASIRELIRRMDDSDNDVREMISNQIDQKSLSAAYIPDLTKQLESSNWRVRADAVKFLGKIGANESTVVLISKMDDSDDDVRNEIAKQLSRRTLADDSVAALTKNFNSRNWVVRKETAKLLGKIKSPASLSALKDQLAKESDLDVKNQIEASMKAARK